jgi:hypothetical protein
MIMAAGPHAKENPARLVRTGSVESVLVVKSARQSGSVLWSAVRIISEYGGGRGDRRGHVYELNRLNHHAFSQRASEWSMKFGAARQ